MTDMTAPMSPAALLALIASGVFFLAGLVTGVWKYRRIMTGPQATAPVYVDICHRASLMYSFACVVLFEFAQRSAWSSIVNLAATTLPIAYFAIAIGSYALHGWLGDTDNQLRRPHRLGRFEIPAPLMSLFFWSLVVAEIGGFVVLFSGFFRFLGVI